MVVHFCPHCGRINLADFLYCPYCGQPVSPGPDLPEAIEEPFARMAELAPEAPGAAPAETPPAAAQRTARPCPAAELESLAARLAEIEADIDELLAARKQS